MQDTNLPEEEKKPNRKAAIPRADIDLADVLKTVSQKWTATPSIVLFWTTPAEFATSSTAFNTTLTDKNNTKSKRPQYTLALEQLDKKIDSNLSYVKNAIINKFKKESAASYYPEFGMEKRDERYDIPRDQNKRSKALAQMNKAIADHGFTDDDYGTAFWGPIKTEYDALLALAKETDTGVSKKVGDKKVLAAYNKKVLNSLIHIIKGNYPDTYAAELRAWGFQKEKY